jgi:hypothetical protein
MFGGISIRTDESPLVAWVRLDLMREYKPEHASMAAEAIICVMPEWDQLERQAWLDNPPPAW